MVSEEEFDEQSKKYDEDIEEINTLFLSMLSATLVDVIEKKKTYTAKELSTKANADIKVLEKTLKSKSTTIKKGVSDIFTDTAQSEWKATESLAKATNKAVVSYADSGLKKATNDLVKPLLSNIDNLSDTTMLGMYYQPNSNAPKVFLNNRDTYIRIVDNAIQAISNGADPHAQIRHSLKQIGDKGIYQVYYDNEGKNPYRLNLESAIRRNIIDGMRDVAQEAQDKSAEIYGSDGIEISVHMMPAPDHAKYQGQQMTNKAFEKLQNSLERPFKKWNCKHYIFRILLGVSVPSWTEKQLKEILDKNEKGVTDTKGIFGKKDKKYTLYESTQQLRQIENATRGLNRQYKLLKDTGDTVGAKRVNTTLKARRAQYNNAIKLLEPFGIRDDKGRFIIKSA